MRNQRTLFVLLLGIILIGSNLRAPLTAVGSLIPFIREDLALSHMWAGMITTLPLLAFALVSPFAPKVAQRFGMEQTIFISLLLLTMGIVLRSLTSISFLFIGTVLIGLAIAFGNVLLPGYIKMSFPTRIGVMTGLYAVFMNLFGALASGISVPLASVQRIGWQGSLGAWAGLVVIAMIIWLPQLHKQKERLSLHRADKPQTKSMWRSFTAWQVTLFMGMQSFIFYTMLTWLPDLLQMNGFNAHQAGWMLSFMQFSIIPFTFVVPIVAGKMKSQSLLTGLTAALFTVGIFGLLQGNSALIPLWVVLIGIASGSAFSLSMMLFTLRTTTGEQAAELSGMAQSFGYLLAAVGPFLFGALYDASASWTQPLMMLIGISIGLLIVGAGAGKNRVIAD